MLIKGLAALSVIIVIPKLACDSSAILYVAKITKTRLDFTLRSDEVD